MASRSVLLLSPCPFRCGKLRFPVAQTCTCWWSHGSRILSLCWRCKTLPVVSPDRCMWMWEGDCLVRTAVPALTFFFWRFLKVPHPEPGLAGGTTGWSRRRLHFVWLTRFDFLTHFWQALGYPLMGAVSVGLLMRYIYYPIYYTCKTNKLTEKWLFKKEKEKKSKHSYH